MVETTGHKAAVWIPFICGAIQAILCVFFLVLGFAYCDNDGTVDPDDPQTLSLLSRSPFISGVAFAMMGLMIHGGKTLIIQKVAFSIIQLINFAFTLTNLITFHVREDKCATMPLPVSDYCADEKNLRVWMLVIHWILVSTQVIAMLTWVVGLIMYRNKTDENVYPPEMNQLEDIPGMKSQYQRANGVDALSAISEWFDPNQLGAKQR